MVNMLFIHFIGVHNRGLCIITISWLERTLPINRNINFQSTYWSTQDKNLLCPATVTRTYYSDDVTPDRQPEITPPIDKNFPLLNFNCQVGALEWLPIPQCVLFVSSGGCEVVLHTSKLMRRAFGSDMFEHFNVSSAVAGGQN